MLHLAVPQSRNRAAVGAVHLELHQFIPVDPHRPGGVDLRDDSAFQFEHRISGVVGSGLVALPVFVPAFRDVGGDARGHGAHRGEELLQDVVPVREHVQHDAAAVFGPVVPTGALRGLPVAFEHPVAELAADGQDAAEEPAVDEAAELEQAGEEELVLDDAVLHAGVAGQLGQFDGGTEVVGDRLFDVDVLARVDGAPNRGFAGVRDLRVEVHRDRVVREDRVEVGAPPLNAVPLSDGAQLLCGMMREPSGSSTPPSLRMARTDLVRCWRYPMRPVTPFMAIPSTRSPICRPTFLMKALSKVCQTRAERQCPGESCCAATGERSSPRPDCTVISHSPYRRGRRSATFLPVRRPLRPLPTVPGKPVSPPTRRFSRTSRRVVPRAYAAVS